MDFKAYKTFTGQVVTPNKSGDIFYETCICPVCKKIIGLRNGDLFGATGLAWFDPYRGKKNKSGKKIGKYVHQECLSLKRAYEVEIANKQA